VEAWQEQFARVRDRLPLRLGVMAFRRMTPFQSVIEAARNLEDELEANSTAEWWWVKQQETRQGVTSLHLRGPKGQDELWTLPVELPDQRRDWFYPYLKTAGRRPRHPHDFQHPDGTLYRHACELEAGEAVCIHPARLAGSFLDHPARRFDEVRPWSPGQWRRMRELWRLLDEQAPSVRALRATWGELLRQREQWQDPQGRWLPGGEEAWLGLVRARLGAALDLRGARLEAVVDAAREGLLAWCLEWHLNVLKLKPGEEA
jgi:PAS domain-containing protein